MNRTLGNASRTNYIYMGHYDQWANEYHARNAAGEQMIAIW